MSKRGATLTERESPQNPAIAPASELDGQAVCKQLPYGGHGEPQPTYQLFSGELSR